MRLSRRLSAFLSAGVLALALLLGNLYPPGPTSPAASSSGSSQVARIIVHESGWD